MELAAIFRAAEVVCPWPTAAEDAAHLKKRMARRKRERRAAQRDIRLVAA